MDPVTRQPAFFATLWRTGLAVALLALISPLAHADDVVPGTKDKTVHDDPSADGWSTEQANNAVGDQIKKLKAALAGHADEAGDLSEVLAPDFTCGPLVPGKWEPGFEDGAFRIRRGSAAVEKSGQAVKGVEAWKAGLAALHSGVEGLRPALKVIRISLAEKEISTTLDFELDQDLPEGTRQLNATWLAAWTREVPPRLRSLTAQGFEESTGKKAALFADVSEAVLGGTKAWGDQLVLGTDHWTGRIDSNLGMEVNGWIGVSLGDANGDGLDDVYVPQQGGLPNLLFIHQPDGTLRETGAAAGVDWLDSSHAALFIDLDNDGDQDLVTGVGDGLVFQENDGKGRFTVKATRLAPGGYPYGLAAADYDQDGDLDIYAACYHQREGVNRNFTFARPIPYHEAENGAPNILFRNDGGWRFTNVTKPSGMDERNNKFSYAPTWEDYDQDGDLDLYVANDFGSNSLYRCDRTPEGLVHFTEVAQSSGVDDPAAGMSACWGDCDNDGRADLYVANMFSSAGNRITFQSAFLNGVDEKTRSLYQRHARGNSLFKNRGDGTFTDVSVEAGVTMGRWAWSSRFIDLNNDGWLDIHVANGYITQEDPHDL